MGVGVRVGGCVRVGVGACVNIANYYFNMQITEENNNNNGNRSNNNNNNNDNINM